jgi:hypothetical protein
MIYVPLAYKFVASAVMLAEVNYCANELHLPVNLPIREQDVQATLVFHPRVIGFAGRIDAKGYSFSFAKSGRLRYVTGMHDDRGKESIAEYHQQLSHLKSIIDADDAYRLATNCLESIDVDVVRLEKERPPIVQQLLFDSPSEGKSTNTKVLLPLFDVRWGNRTNPTIRVSISGVTGGLLVLRQEDDSYSKRPASLIKDVDELLAIPDEEFLKYSLLERNNLVARFSAVSYPVSTNEIVPRTTTSSTGLK